MMKNHEKISSEKISSEKISSEKISSEKISSEKISSEKISHYKPNYKPQSLLTSQCLTLSEALAKLPHGHHYTLE